MYNFCFVQKNRPEVKTRTFPTILFKLSTLIHNIVSHHSWSLSLYLAHQVSLMVQNIDNTSLISVLFSDRKCVRKKLIVFLGHLNSRTKCWTQISKLFGSKILQLHLLRWGHLTSLVIKLPNYWTNDRKFVFFFICVERNASISLFGFWKMQLLKDMNRQTVCLFNRFFTTPSHYPCLCCCMTNPGNSKLYIFYWPLLKRFK